MTNKSPEEIARAVFKECADYWSMGTPIPRDECIMIAIIASAINSARNDAVMVSEEKTEETIEFMESLHKENRHVQFHNGALWARKWMRDKIENKDGI